MIRNETEYKEAVQRVAEEASRLKAERAKLQEMDLSKAEIKRALDPVRSFHEQLKEEVESYERLMRGESDPAKHWLGDAVLRLQRVRKVDRVDRYAVYKRADHRENDQQHEGEQSRDREAVAAELMPGITPERPRGPVEEVDVDRPRRGRRHQEYRIRGSRNP